MQVLLDATGALPGYLPTLLSRIPTGTLPSHPMSILLLPDQAEREGISLPPGLRKLDVSDSAAVPQRVMQWLTECPQGEQIILGSFRPEVLELQYREPFSTRPQTEVHSVGKFLTRYAEEAGVTSASFTWSDQVLPADVALEVLKQALRGNGGQLRKTQLRPRLEREDKVFLKSNPLTSNPRVIGALVSLAEKRGVVTVVNNEHNDPVITLVEQSPGSMPVTSTVAIAPPQATATSHLEPPAKPYVERFTEALERVRMGPFANLRPHFYKSLERRVRESLVVDSLVSRCIGDVRAAYVDGGNVESRLPWPIVRRFFERLLTRSPVLLDENGERLWPCFDHAGVKVHSLLPNFILELEGALVLFLLDEVNQIVYADVPAITGCLYLTRLESDRYQLLEVLSFLRKSGKLELAEDHYRPVATTVTAK